MLKVLYQEMYSTIKKVKVKTIVYVIGVRVLMLEMYSSQYYEGWSIL